MAAVRNADQMLKGESGGGEVNLNWEASNGPSLPSKKKSRSSRDAAALKRRCVSTACIACRKRKSKCDGNTPSCAACSSVYGTGEYSGRLFLADKLTSWNRMRLRPEQRSPAEGSLQGED